jgi:UDP-N-acetyl-D-glucosamine dehydrogenase
VNPAQTHVVVIGVGYVGLPLVAEFLRAGFRVTAYDKDAGKVACLSRGESYIADVPESDIAPHAETGRLRATADPAVLAEADAIIICVPTPLSKTKEPDLRFIVAAADEIAAHQRPGMLVVLESTTYPGTTTDVLVPKLTAGGYEIGKDVFVAFSPERVDPGNREFKVRNTPKVVGGSTPACLDRAVGLYEHIVETVVPVSSTATAEMAKLLENTFRAVNIGLANEIALMARRLGVDPFEVIRAAATKPFGFMPFYPGPGIGGHCIPVDPLYLSWKLRTLKYEARFIDLADSVNSSMPAHVVARAAEALNTDSKSLRGSRVLIYGAAYKRDVSDVRESPALDIIAGLSERGAVVDYMDPHVPEIETGSSRMMSVSPESSFAPYDLVIIVTDHAELDRYRLAREARLILDTRDAMRGIGCTVHSL